MSSCLAPRDDEVDERAHLRGDEPPRWEVNVEREALSGPLGEEVDEPMILEAAELELERLRAADVVESETLDFLSGYRFSGNISGYAEGECFFPGSPLLAVEGTFAESVLLETVLLSILNHDSAIASAASRMTNAAGGSLDEDATARRDGGGVDERLPGDEGAEGQRGRLDVAEVVGCPGELARA